MLLDNLQGILDAIAAENPAEGERLALQHITGARDALLAHLTQHPGDD